MTLFRSQISDYGMPSFLAGQDSKDQDVVDTYRSEYSVALLNNTVEAGVLVMKTTDSKGIELYFTVQGL